MSYKLEWNPSPNFTPGSQTQRFYGQPRSIRFGAGHWWNLPTAGATHDGVVGIFKNRARQGSAHAVLSAGRVTEMVRKTDTAWTTNNANPYTYSIEVDPRIMWKWTATGSKKALGERIFNTLVEYITDKGMHNLTWYPHKKWFSTQCNPIYWGKVMEAAKKLHAARAAAKNIKWNPFDNPRKMIANRNTRVINLKTGKGLGSTIKKGTIVDFKTKTIYKGVYYIRSSYSTSKKLDHGLLRGHFSEVPKPPAEWEKNLKDITDVKLQVLAKNAPIYDLNTGKEIGKPIPQGTWVDIAKQTTRGGKVYLISAYSVKNAQANGILKDHLGIPAPVPEPPKPQPEPEWLKNWEDIKDVTMFARDDIDAVNLLTGDKVGDTIAKGTPIKIASSTEWMGQKYLITEYSTAKKVPVGIRLLDLNLKAVEDTSDPIPEDPKQPVDDVLDGIKQNNSLLQQILDLLKRIFNIK